MFQRKKKSRSNGFLRQFFTSLFRLQTPRRLGNHYLSINYLGRLSETRNLCQTYELVFKDENKPAIYFKIWFLPRSKRTPSLVKPVS